MLKKMIVSGILLMTLAFQHEPHPAANGYIDFNKNGKKDIYEDPAQPVEARVNDLLRQMNLDEKTSYVCITRKNEITVSLHKY